MRTSPAIPTDAPAGNATVKNNRERVLVGADYPVRERIAFAIRITMVRGTVRDEAL
jgi:hypothetical protein